MAMSSAQQQENQQREQEMARKSADDWVQHTSGAWSTLEAAQ
jgi:hypothetical protein